MKQYKTVMLPVDHGDFSDYYGQDGLAAGDFNQPAYLDTDVDLTHAYTYYAAIQTGVPTLDTEWQKIQSVWSDIGGNYSTYSYYPFVNEFGLSGYQTTANGQPAIHLTWLPDNNQTGNSLASSTGYNYNESNGYIIQWSTNPDFSSYNTVQVSDPVQVNGSIPSAKYDDYTFTANDAGTSLTGTYYFRISAVAGVTSNIINDFYPDWDGPAAVTIGANVVPTGTPTIVSAAADAQSPSSQVDLNWDLSNIDWQGVPTNNQYVVVEMSTDGGGFVVEGNPIPVGDGTSSINLTNNITAGTNYAFRIRAVASTDGGNTVEAGTAPSATFSVPTKPDEASVYNAVAFGPHLMHMEWVKVDGPDIEYVVERTTDNNSWPSLGDPSNVILPAYQTTYNGTDVTYNSSYLFDDTNVSENTLYYYRVAAVTLPVNGVQGIAGDYGYPEGAGTDPAAPTNLTMTQQGDGTIKLSWTNNSSAPRIRIYYTNSRFNLNGSGDGFTQLDDYSIADANPSLGEYADHYILTPSPGENYTFRLVAEGNYGWMSEPSNVSTWAPIAPTYVSATQVGPESVQVTWNFESSSALTDIESQNEEGFRLLNETKTTISWVSSDRLSTGSIDVPANVSSYIIDNTTLIAEGLAPLDLGKTYIISVMPWNVGFDGAAQDGGSTNAAEVVDMSALPNDSLDSFRIGQPYEYQKTGAAAQHYGGSASVSPNYDGLWKQYESPAIALGVGAVANVETLWDEQYPQIYMANVGLIPNANPAHPYNTLSLYEDTLYDIEYGGHVAPGQENGFMRWSVEQRPTVRGQATGVVTINGVQKAQFTLNRSGDTSQGLRVTYAISANGGMVGNYDEPSGVAVFLPGESAATIDVPLHSGYDAAIGALNLSLNWTNESDAETVGSPYVAGANGVLVTTPAAGSSIFFSGLDIDYYSGRGQTSTLESLASTNQFNIKILGNSGNDLLYGVGSPSNDTVNFDGGGGFNEIYYGYVLSTLNFDVYTDHVMQTTVGDGVTSIISFAPNTPIMFSQFGDGATGQITIHMVTDDDTLTPLGDGYQWDWVSGQQSLGFAIEDSASGYNVTMLPPVGSSKQPWIIPIGGKGDM